MEKMREEFEKMCAGIGVSTTKITVVDCGIATTGYQSEEVNEMFGVFCFAWKASRAAMCVELPEREVAGKYADDFEDGHESGFNDALSDCKVAIKKAGVSYK